jgi:hypothetical protein
VAPSWMLRRIQAKDGWIDTMGCIRLFNHRITVFFVLDCMSNLVFYLRL